MDYQGELLPVAGGLRLSFTTHPEQPLPDRVHAGDKNSAVGEAKVPRVFPDEGAFDQRAYFAGQGIDCTAILRATELLEREGPPTKTEG